MTYPLSKYKAADIAYVQRYMKKHKQSYPIGVDDFERKVLNLMDEKKDMQIGTAIDIISATSSFN